MGNSQCSCVISPQGHTLYTHSLSAPVPPFILFPAHLSIFPSITHPLIEVAGVAIGANKEPLVWRQILLTYKGNPSACQALIM